MKGCGAKIVFPQLYIIIFAFMCQLSGNEKINFPNCDDLY